VSDGPPDGQPGTCRICGGEMPLREIVQHLCDEHGCKVPLKWPDGAWVVIDRTLEPKDFA
jgi:hypothetical protein